MQIRFFATIREITRQSAIEWNGPAVTLGELLRDLSARYGSNFRRWCLEGRAGDVRLGPSIIILVNGHDSRHAGGIHAPLRPDDVISIFPMVAGGSLQAPRVWELSA